MKATVTILFLLTFSGTALAQTQTPEQQQEDFKNACVAGALKAGCPKLAPQTIPGQQLVIPPADHSLDHALDNPVQTFVLPKVTPAAPSPTPSQPAPVTEITPQFKSTPVQPVFVPAVKPLGQRQSSANCGPSIPPPGAGALYGVNRAACLRRVARQRQAQ
jgi:hypothetical protein